MREVAARARVSQKTVSRVFNADPHVRPDTRLRVQQAMDELDYTPNPIATAFRSGKVPVIGIAVPDIVDPFFAAIVRAAEEELRRVDMSALVTSLGDDPAREPEAIQTLLRRAPSGIIMAPISADQSYLAHEVDGLPVVFIDRPPRGFAADSICDDDYAGGRMAVEHLLEKGHRRIAFIGDTLDLPTTSGRLRAYRETLASAGLEAAEETVLLGVTDRATARAHVERLLDQEQPPTAIFSSNARITMALVPSLRGTDLSLVSFGDFPMADCLAPPVCVVDQDPASMGRLAVERVLSGAGKAGDAREPVRDVLEVGIVERGSCRPAPSRDTADPA